MWNESDVKEWSQWIKTRFGTNHDAGRGTKCHKESDHYGTDAVCTNNETTRRCDTTKEPHHNPGRLDPQIGTYQTDAPTTYRFAVQVAVTLAACFGYFQ